MKFTLFQTKKGNWYFFSFYQRQILPCHPILKFILEDENKSQEVVKWLMKKDEITIDNQSFTKSEIKYYCDKYEYLSERQYFDEIVTDSAFSKAINSRIINQQLANCNVICLELTENCNLRCKYCVYGDNYSFHEDRIGVNMSLETAKTAIDYLFEIWKKNNNNAYQRKYVGFYGGEPLLRMKQIKSIVSYFNNKAAEIGLDTGFLITTNGVLLDKYIDYLFDNHFSLLISLDGDKFADQYRVFPNGTPSFDVVSKNVELVRNRYPEYYRDDISFSVVLHDKNEEFSVRKFFDEIYEKTPIVAVLRNTDTDNPTRFQYHPQTQPNYYGENFDINCFLKTGDAQAFLRFINYYGRTVVDNYGIYSFASLNDIPRHPTGVCMPFAKKLFVTAQGKILPCERINFKYSLGYIKNKKVFLDTTKIAESYIEQFNKCKSLCTKCYNFINCERCLFNDVLHNDGNYCLSYMNRKTHSLYLSQMWSAFESNPQMYHQVKSKISYE